MAVFISILSTPLPSADGWKVSGPITATDEGGKIMKKKNTY